MSTQTFANTTLLAKGVHKFASKKSTHTFAGKISTHKFASKNSTRMGSVNPCIYTHDEPTPPPQNVGEIRVYENILGQAGVDLYVRLWTFESTNPFPCAHDEVYTPHTSWDNSIVMTCSSVEWHPCRCPVWTWLNVYRFTTDLAHWRPPHPNHPHPQKEKGVIRVHENICGQANTSMGSVKNEYTNIC